MREVRGHWRHLTQMPNQVHKFILPSGRPLLSCSREAVNRAHRTIAVRLLDSTVYSSQHSCLPLNSCNKSQSMVPHNGRVTDAIRDEEQGTRNFKLSDQVAYAIPKKI